MNRAVPSHIGEIIRRVREARNVSPAHLAKRCDVHVTTIQRLEEGRTRRPTDKRRLVRNIAEALQSADIPRPLTASQTILLNRLNKADDEHEERQVTYSTIDFRTFVSTSPADEVAESVEWLRRQDRPAMITDPLMMICAINGAVPRLFGTTPDDPALKRWDMWHVVSGRIRPDSPVKVRQPNRDFIQMNVAYFFQSSGAGDYLFTAQMQELLRRMYDLAERHQSPFGGWWERALAFDLPLDLEAMPRSMVFEDRGAPIELWTKIIECDRREVELVDGHPVRLQLSAWEPLDAKAELVFERVSRFPDSHRVLFAADYDQGGTLHINHWPEVRARLNKNL